MQPSKMGFFLLYVFPDTFHLYEGKITKTESLKFQVLDFLNVLKKTVERFCKNIFNFHFFIKK